MTEQALNDDGTPRDTFSASVKAERWQLMSDEWIVYCIGEFAKGYAEAVLYSGIDSALTVARWQSLMEYATAALKARSAGLIVNVPDPAMPRNCPHRDDGWCAACSPDSAEPRESGV